MSLSNRFSLKFILVTFVILAFQVSRAAVILLTEPKDAILKRAYEELSESRRSEEMIRLIRSSRELRWDPDLSYAESQNYNNLVNSIQPGDQVVIGNRVFHIKAYLGGDSATRVFEINDGRILRLPNHRNSISAAMAYLDSYAEYEANGVDVIKVYKEESNRYGIVTNKIHDIILLSEFMESLKSKMEKSIPYSPSENFMLQQLPRLEYSLAYYRNLRDVHPGQVGFDSVSKKWVLFDWLYTELIASSIQDPTPIYPYLVRDYNEVIPHEIHGQIRKAIFDRRSGKISCTNVL